MPTGKKDSHHPSFHMGTFWGGAVRRHTLYSAHLGDRYGTRNGSHCFPSCKWKFVRLDQPGPISPSSAPSTTIQLSAAAFFNPCRVDIMQCLSLSGLFHLARCPPFPSMLLTMTGTPSLFWGAEVSRHFMEGLWGGSMCSALLGDLVFFSRIFLRSNSLTVFHVKKLKYMGGEKLTSLKS